MPLTEDACGIDSWVRNHVCLWFCAPGSPRLSAEGGVPAWGHSQLIWRASFLPRLIACSGTFFSDSEASSSIRGDAGSSVPCLKALGKGSL